MNRPKRLVWLIAAVSIASRVLVTMAQAQSATITVASIPRTVAGSSISVNWTVQNTATSPRTFGVGAEIRLGSTVLADLGGQTTATIAPGATASGSFSYTVPAGWTSGTYIARAAVWTGAPGLSTFLNSFDRNFTVQPVALSLAGRIAFHRDSDNQSLHLPINADDGHIFVIDLSNNSVARTTSGFGIGNCLNPHFSPDGSSLTFMAIPAGQALLWSNLRVYVLNLADNTPPFDLGNGQDPKFAPDGLRIIYKKVDGQLFAISSDGTSPQTLTSGGAERSGPNYSPVLGDGRIVFWNTTAFGPTR